MAEELINQPMAGGEEMLPAEGLPEQILPEQGQPGQVMPEQVPADEQAMRQDIERKLSDVGSQNNALETKKFISKNKLKNFKVEMLRDIYSMLQTLGVDPADPESIKNFLLSLEEQDPDLLILFQTIFDTLSPDNVSSIDELGNSAPEMAPPGAMPQGELGAPEQMLAGSPLPPEPMAPPVPPTGPPAIPETPPTSGGGGGSDGLATSPNLMDKYSNLQNGILR